MFDVCERVRARRGAIVDRFKAEVEARGLLRDLPEPLLVDDLGELVDRFCDALEGAARHGEGPALKHAHVRWEAGVDIGGVVREYGVLALSIIAVLAEDGVALAPHEQLALVTTINRAAAITVQQYAKFRDAEYATQYNALRATEAIRDALIVDAPIGVAFLDRELRYVLINDHLAQLNGIAREGHIGRTPAEILPQPFGEHIMSLAREAIESGASRRDTELTGETPAAPGVARAWIGHWYPVRLGGEIIGVGVLVEETTERKRAAALREHLIGVVSHDLRNPLNSIVMSASLVLKQPELAESTRGLVRRCLTSAKRMAGIIEQLYDYVSLDQGRGLPLSRTHIDLSTVARRVVDEVKLALPDRGDVQIDVDGDLQGDWDESRIAQVLSNLVGNALEHGTGTVTVLLRGEPDVVHVEVRNPGRPIPPEKLERIFEPLKGDGGKGHLGLGLFIACEIVRAHGGRLRAASNEEATVFTVDLPRARDVHHVAAA